MSRATVRGVFMLLGGAIALPPPPVNECADYDAPHHLSADQDLATALVRVSNSAANVNLCEAMTHTFHVSGVFPGAAVGIPYDESVKVVGGDEPFTVEIASGDVPPGLMLEMHPTDPRKIRLHGTVVTGDIVINGVLPAATIGQAYSERLQVINAAGGVTVSIVAGAMPPWMTMTWHADTQEIEFHGMPT